MSLVKITQLENGISELRINRPKANALNHELIIELRESIDSLQANKANKATVLTGMYPFFSAGLDVIELYGYDKDKMSAFWNDFKQVIISFLSYDKPLIAAISGHSPAGGCILALCADYRIMTEGKNKIGLNEAAVSIVIPKAVRNLYASVVGFGTANKSLSRGTLYEANAALAIGLVDEVCTAEELDYKALLIASKMSSLPSLAWSASKRILREELIAEFKDEQKSGFADAANYWWEQDCRAYLEKMISALKQPKQ